MGCLAATAALLADALSLFGSLADALLPIGSLVDASPPYCRPPL